MIELKHIQKFIFFTIKFKYNIKINNRCLCCDLNYMSKVNLYINKNTIDICNDKIFKNVFDHLILYIIKCFLKINYLYNYI